MIDLKLFCGNDREIRSYLRAPFELDGYVYATNGHMLVQVPASEYPGYVPYEKGRHPKNVADMVRGAIAGDSSEFVQLPQIDEPPKCSECKGTGVYTYDDDEGPEDCMNCGGSGYERSAVIAIGNATFAAHYVWELRILPGATFKANGMTSPAAINFEGGVALLMPCKP